MSCPFKYKKQFKEPITMMRVCSYPDEYLVVDYLACDMRQSAECVGEKRCPIVKK